MILASIKEKEQRIPHQYNLKSKRSSALEDSRIHTNILSRINGKTLSSCGKHECLHRDYPIIDILRIVHRSYENHEVYVNLFIEV